MNSIGLALLWKNSVSDFAGATIRVSSGTESADAPVSAPPEVVAVKAEGDAPPGVGLSFSATFGPSEANFEWNKREVLVNGEVIDTKVEDLGRKVLGAIWVADTILVLEEE